MRKVAHLVSRYLPLTETFIYEYLNSLRNHPQIILTYDTQNLELFPVEHLYSFSNLSILERAWNFLVRKLAWNPPTDSALSLPSGATLFFEKMIKKQKVNLIHAHFGPMGVQGIPLKKRCKIPLITTFYGFDVSALPHESYWKSLYQRLFNEGDLFLVEGGHMKKSLVNLACPPEKVSIQHLAVDVNKFEYCPRMLDKDENIKILMCGRFVEKKGFTYALKAFAKVRKMHKNIELRIVGDGILRGEIEKVISDLDISKSVKLLGCLPHSECVKEFLNSHILMVPSVTAQDGDSEGGAPTVLLEGQSTGMPVIGTYHADIPEVVIDGKSGLLTKERDVEGLAIHLEYLIEHPEVWEKMGRCGREHILKEHDVSEEVKKLEQTYNILLEKYGIY